MKLNCWLALFVGLLAIVPIAEADLKNGLVAYYPLNGNAYDKSGNANHCVSEGAIHTGGIEGAVEGAYEFDGADDYLDCGNGSALSLSTAITVAAWVRPDTYAHGFVATKWKTENSLSGSWILGISDQQFPQFAVTANCLTAFPVISGTSVSSGVYSHLAGVYDIASNEIRIFVNGALTGTVLGPGGLCVSSSRMLVGAARYVAGNLHYDGVVDELRIYDRVLSPEEILDLYLLPPQQSRVFAASTHLTGNLGGLTGADQICENRAAVAGLGEGPWVAWLSTSTTHAVDRLAPGGSPFVRASDTATLIAADIADLTGGQLQNAIMFDELGLALGPEEAPWTGTWSDGEGIGSPPCADWTSSSGTQAGVRGSVTSTDHRWTADTGVGEPIQTCDFDDGALYCFEAPCLAVNGATLVLSNSTILGIESFRVCDRVTVGPDLEVMGPGGDLTLRVGDTVEFLNGFSVLENGKLTIERDPLL